MSRKQEIMTAAGTVACAIGIGFVMQSGQSAQDIYGQSLTVASAPAVIVTSMQQTSDPQIAPQRLSVEDIVLTSADISGLDDIGFKDVPVQITQAPDILEAPEVYRAAAKTACTLTLSAEPAAAAMVSLSLEAPCLPKERLSVSHDRMTFSHSTGPDGTLSLTVPAFTEFAEFNVTFSGGESVSTRVQVDSLPLYDRVAVQWTGDVGLELHAREFGASYGDRGHIWSGSERDLSSMAQGIGGIVTQHGDTALPLAKRVEVYTFPKAMAKSSGLIDLTVEAEITEQTCGRQVTAQTLQTELNGSVTMRDISLNMPGCDAVGDFLVLNNLIEDLRVAQK